MCMDACVCDFWSLNDAHAYVWIALVACSFVLKKNKYDANLGSNELTLKTKCLFSCEAHDSENLSNRCEFSGIYDT